ncbi:MAG: KH domain RNA binding protein YlqC [Ignavibacteriae bacterium]|nr:MAG: KH domain RNA binding protein YlqC [Ignavibacteriota bacterium]
MKEFIEFIAKNLVDSPDEVSITEETKDNKVVFRLKVGQNDIGKVIGKKGKTAQAMRVLLSAVGAKSGKRTILEIIDK